MPERWKSLVDKIRKNLQGKTNPRTKKPYTESDIYAIAMAQYKKMYGTTPTREDICNMIREDRPDFFLMEYFVPIDVSEMGKDFVITGTAIDSSVSRNNIRYLSDELKNSVSSLKNAPILDSHRQDSVKNILGIVQDAFFDDSSNSIKFRGKIMDKEIQQMISDGRIKNVSIGAKVESLPKEENSEVMTAKGIEFLELSLVPIQGVKNATISQAIFEKYSFVDDVEKILKEINDGESMTDEIKKEDFDALKKTVEDYKVLEETLKKENTELKAQLEESKKTSETKEVKLEERMISFEKTLASLNEKLDKIIKEQDEEEEEEIDEKAKPKTVVNTEETPQDTLIKERYADGVSLWRMPK